MRAGRPWKAMRSPAMSSQRCRWALSGNSSFILASVLAMSSGSPGAPPSGRAHALAEQRAHVGGHEAGKSKALASRPSPAPPGGGCCRSPRWGCPWPGSPAWPARARRSRFARGLFERGVLAVAILLRPSTARPSSRGQVAVDQVVGRGLVGDDVRTDATRLGAAHQLRAGCRPHCRSRAIEMAFFSAV